MIREDTASMKRLCLLAFGLGLLLIAAFAAGLSSVPILGLEDEDRVFLITRIAGFSVAVVFSVVVYWAADRLDMIRCWFGRFGNGDAHS